VAVAGGAGEHQHREPVAGRLGRWCGPRLTVTAAKQQGEQDRGDCDRPSDALAGRKGKEAHRNQGTLMP
jgi:hypothetical protein